MKRIYVKVKLKFIILIDFTIILFFLSLKYAVFSRFFSFSRDIFEEEEREEELMYN